MYRVFPCLAAPAKRPARASSVSHRLERPRTVGASPAYARDMPVDETSTPDDHDDETQARHVASRAELLPGERAAGSDDPQEQAKVIPEESEERTEHPDPDASSQ